ncbi:hypothetical protein [Rossellomorea marisflavi]|uniref:hypothetical protein n=1 Tax=Rossellomorea marisflavi TaxID=189381 RepID=UPI0012E113F2|nr:hypothetical protein [Rossellomorea marisflavi]
MKSLELIKKKRSPIAANNVYVFNKPVKSVEELIVKFPEVEKYRDERLAKIKASEQTSKKRFAAG